MDTQRLSSPHYRPDIDGLRGLAVFFGVMFHAFPSLLQGGFIGVDLFFVISGYLIATILFTNLQQHSFSFVAFYSRRIRRIFPSLIAVLFACYAAGWILLMPSDYKELGKHMAGGAGFIANFVFWNEAGYFDAASETKLLLNLWSLGIEEQFYILFPVLVFLTFRLRAGNRSLLLPLLAVLMLLSFSLNILNATDDPDGTFYSPLTRFWGILAGALLACGLPQHHIANPLHTNTKADNVLSAVAMLCIIYAAFCFTDDTAYPDWRGLSPVCGAILVIAAGPKAWANRWLLSNRPIIWLGWISYPLYLWHWPILSFAHLYYGHTPSVEVRIGALALSVALAALSWRFLEKPIRSGGHNHFKVAALSLMMLLAGCIGYFTSAQNGLPLRYPPLVQSLSNFKISVDNAWRFHRCFLLDTEQKNAPFATECEDSSHRPSVFIWGDSHAAVFYSGFKAFAEKHQLAVSQYSLMGCPPMLDFDPKYRPHCKAANDIILQRIKKTKPDYVVLAARWSREFYDIQKLENTAKALQQLKIPHIVVIGQVPFWEKFIPHLLLDYWKKDPLHRLPPAYTQYMLDPAALPIDQRIRQLSTNLGLDYLSSYDALCNTQGCLTRLGDTPEQLAYYDNQHMTQAGAEYLVNQFADYFIKDSKN